MQGLSSAGTAYQGAQGVEVAFSAVSCAAMQSAQKARSLHDGGGGACRGGGGGRRAGRVGEVGRHDLFFRQFEDPAVLLNRALPAQTDLVLLGLGGDEVSVSQLEPRPLQAVVELQHQVAPLDGFTLAKRDSDRVAADLGRQSGAPVRLDGAGSGVGDG
ncbi:MAG: hypothetical protein VYE73_14655 [Acidobacteriota bacterium]|nr:hypothetical protein [Acidobacteriota bacterium]